MKLWIWNIIVGIVGIIGMSTSLQYNNTNLMGTTGMLTFNTFAMSFFLYFIESEQK